MIGELQEDSIDSAMECLLNNDPTKDIIFVRYVEIENGIAKEDEEFMDSWHHFDLRQPLVKKEWKIAPVLLCSIEHFKEIGGLDCKNYEHINMNVIAFCFRSQELGSKVLRPDKLVLKCQLQRNRTPENNPVIRRFF